MNLGSVLVLVGVSGHRGIIGAEGRLPWPKLTIDFAFLRYITQIVPTGLIMGSNTYRSIGKPLANRISIVVTTKVTRAEKDIGETNLFYVPNLETAVNLCIKNNLLPVVFGGESIYRLALEKYSGTIYMTSIETEYPGDRHFPIDLINKYAKTNITKSVLEAVTNQSIDQSTTNASETFSIPQNQSTRTKEYFDKSINKILLNNQRILNQIEFSSEEISNTYSTVVPQENTPSNKTNLFYTTDKYTFTTLPNITLSNYHSNFKPLSIKLDLNTCLISENSTNYTFLKIEYIHNSN
ncbi:dihydrofolate reductase [Nematocida sp. AWRm80]|nr:dihydrofolate reductase [Nematocida sp. AWRm80]